MERALRPSPWQPLALSTAVGGALVARPLRLARLPVRSTRSPTPRPPVAGKQLGECVCLVSAARKVYEQAGVMTVSKSTLTVEETAELLGISRGLAFQAVARGDIPSIRIGRRILVPVARLRTLL